MNTLLDIIICIGILIISLIINGLKNRRIINAFKRIIIIIGIILLVLGIGFLFIPMWFDIGLSLILIGVISNIISLFIQKDNN